MPELQKLRTKHTHMGAQPLPGGGIAQAELLPSSAAGLQLEIIASFKLSNLTTDRSRQQAAGKFGVAVLAASDKHEYTAITFDLTREQLLLDRSLVT